MDLAAHAQAIAEAYRPPAAGRPSVIGDQETIHEFFEAVEAGNYIETAAELAGISTETLRQWRLRAEAGEEPFTAFIATLKRLERRAEAKAVANVRAAGRKPQFWAAEMTFLERRHPDRWGRRSESDNAPRVVVQLGVKDSDVSIAITTPNALSPLDSQQLDTLSTSQVRHQCLINGPSVNSLAASEMPDRGAGTSGGTQPGQPASGLADALPIKSTPVWRARKEKRRRPVVKRIAKNVPENGAVPPLENHE